MGAEVSTPAPQPLPPPNEQHKRVPSALVVVGPSGVGKGTLINRLMQGAGSEAFGFSVSHTTRDPRPGEKHGEHYFFTTKEQFAKEVGEGKFLEYAEVHGNLYGTSVRAVQSVLETGRVCILDIDIQGARSVRASGLRAIFVFLAPPSLEDLAKRLARRGTETVEQIKRRLDNAKHEVASINERPPLYDYLLVNDNLEECLLRLRGVAARAAAGLDAEPGQVPESITFEEPAPQDPAAASTSDDAPPSHAGGQQQPAPQPHPASGAAANILEAPAAPLELPSGAAAGGNTGGTDAAAATTSASNQPSTESTVAVASTASPSPDAASAATASSSGGTHAPVVLPSLGAGDTGPGPAPPAGHLTGHPAGGQQMQSDGGGYSKGGSQPSPPPPPQMSYQPPAFASPAGSPGHLARWQGKVALVTGASAGIGWETCEALAMAGLHVVAIARRKDRLEALQLHMHDRGITQAAFLPIVCDITKEAEVAMLPRIVAKRWPGSGIDVLVNNAGMARNDASLFEGSVASWVEMLSTNVLGTCLCTKAVLLDMQQRGSYGHIINIIGLSGHRIPDAPQGGTFYCATKAAVKTLTEGLRQEARSRGVPLRVSGISPGMVETEFFTVRAFGDEAAGSRAMSVKQALQPSDIAAAILWCLAAPDHMEVNDIVVRPTEQVL